MMKRRKKTAQFCTLIKTTVDEEEVEHEEALERQDDIEDEVCSFSERMYRKVKLST